jgi:uncharacterized protein (DUF2062 family)
LGFDYWGRKLLSFDNLGNKQLAFTLTIGCLIGLCPLFGITTALATIIAQVFRMNLIVIQTGNYLVYPLQLLLIIPLIRFGNLFTGNRLPEFSEGFLIELKIDPHILLGEFGNLIIDGATGWLLIVAPAGLIIFPFWMLLIRQLRKNRHSFLQSKHN